MAVLLTRVHEDQIHRDPDSCASALPGGLVHVRNVLMVLVHLLQHLGEAGLSAEANVTDTAGAERFYLLVGHPAKQVGGSLKRPAELDAGLHNSSGNGN